MKNLLLISPIIALMLACSSQPRTTEKVTATVDQLLASPDSFVDKEVLVSGTVSHVCRHGGQKLFLFGGNPDKFIQVNTGESQPEFEVSLEGTEVQIDGIFKELRMDETYVSNLEEETSEMDTLNEEGEMDSLNIHTREQQMQNAAYLRKQIEESGKGYISEFWIDNLSIQPKEAAKK